MLLGGGKLGNKRILQSETVAEMSRNQIGDLMLAELRSLTPQFAKDPIRIPGSLDKFGLGFGINTRPVEGGRSRGSLAWAGIYNTFFWIDPPRKTCAVIMMQILPFSDDAANSVVERFERAVYGLRPSLPNPSKAAFPLPRITQDSKGSIPRARAPGEADFNVSAARAIQICPNPPSTLISTPVM
jgi:CubicO group peptidase (beta-lactamase class C family)